MRYRPRYVRDRLTLWYVMVFGAVLVAYICGASLLEFWQLSNQMYHSEIQDVETAEGLLYFTADGTLGLHEEYHNHPETRLLLDRLVEVLSLDGRVLFRNEKLNGRDLGGAPFPHEGQSSYNQRSLRLEDGTRVLLISHVHTIQGRPLLIRLAYSTAPLHHRVAEFIALLFLAVPVALIGSAFAGYRLAGKTLDPLQEMVRQTEQITANRLSDRIPIENPQDELGQMANVLNGLLHRLEESFDQLKRFTSDVSHELRTPLAAMRSVGEVALQKDQSPEAYRDVIGSMLEEVTRLTRMIDALLTISRADAGQIGLQKSSFRFNDLVQEVVALVGVLAEEKEVALEVRGDNAVWIDADRTILRQAVLNLLDNAVKYSPVQSRVLITLMALPAAAGQLTSAELLIADQGSGISAEYRTRVFDRFFRVDEARSREAGGAGLGLSIAKWAVEIHGGEIGVEPGPANGSAFYIRLPCLLEDPADWPPPPIADHQASSIG